MQIQADSQVAFRAASQVGPAGLHRRVQVVVGGQPFLTSDHNPRLGLVFDPRANPIEDVVVHKFIATQRRTVRHRFLGKAAEIAVIRLISGKLSRPLTVGFT